MQKLIDGLRQFMTTVQKDECELFERLAREQRPEVLFVTCSDSRISPNLMTQTMPGELFVLRNAGNIVPPHGAVDGGEAATVEYAVAALGVRDIVVCGHSDCGAMKGLMTPEACAHLPLVSRWLAYAEPTLRIVSQRTDLTDPAERLQLAIEVNVLSQLAHLRSHPAVAARMAAGDLELHGWVYDIASGRVRAFDSAAGTFVDLLELGCAQAPRPAGPTTLVA